MYSILSESCLWHCIVRQNCFNCTLQLSNIDITTGLKVVSYNKVWGSWTGINWLLLWRLFWSIWERVSVGKRSIQWSVNLAIPPSVRKALAVVIVWGCFCLLKALSTAVTEAVSSTCLIQEDSSNSHFLASLFVTRTTNTTFSQWWKVKVKLDVP